MRYSCALAALAAVCCVALPCLSEAAPPELTSLQQQYEKAVAERVTALHEAAVAKLNAGYVGGLGRTIAASKTAGDLQTIILLEAEKKRIADKEAMPADDDNVSKTLKVLRAVYRKELAKLEAQRAANAATILAPFIAKLKQLESTLTKSNRVDDAKAVMAYREGLAADAAIVSRTGGGPPPGKFPPGDDRKAAEWVIQVGGRVTVNDGSKDRMVAVASALPAGKFVVTTVELRFDTTRQPKQPIDDLLPLSGLKELKTLSVHEVRSLTDEDMEMLASLPALTYLAMNNCTLTDAALPLLAKVRGVVHLSVFGNVGINGTTLPALLPLEKLTRLNLGYCQLSEAGIAHLAQFTRLETLSLCTPNFTDAHLPVLDGMRKLDGLLLESCGVTLAGVASRASLNGLTSFGLTVPPGNAKASWAALAKTCPGLEELTLGVPSGGALSEEDLSGLGAFPKLRYLWLNRNAASDASVAGLLQVKSLQQLLLVNQSITDAAIEGLLPHRGLREITFNVSQITDAGLVRLAQMKGLQKVELMSCPKVTDEGIAALKKARPEITVSILR